MSREWDPLIACIDSEDWVDLLLMRARSFSPGNFVLRGWTEQQTATIRQMLFGIAHDGACGCEDSTVTHLAEWMREQRERQEVQE